MLEIKLQEGVSGAHLEALSLLATDTLAIIFTAVEARRPSFDCSARLLADGKELHFDPSTTLASAGLSSCTIEVVWCTWHVVASSSTDSVARIWNADIGECVCELKGHSSDVNSVILDARLFRALTASDDHTAKLWDLKTGACILTFTGHTSIVWFGTFSPDNTTVLTASGDATSKIWNAMTGDCTMTFKGHRSSIRSAVFSRDGQHVATASADFSAKLWHVTTGFELQTLPLQNEALAVVFLHQDRSLAVASKQCLVQIWDLCMGTCSCLVEAEAKSIAASPCGCYLATCTGDMVRLWDVDTRSCVQIINEHADVNSVAFSADGASAMTASRDWTVRVWSTSSGDCCRKLVGHRGDVLWVS